MHRGLLCRPATALFDLDLSELKPENLEDLIYPLKELTVDVDEEASKARVFCE
jgi:hypothetical protein